MKKPTLALIITAMASWAMAQHAEPAATPGTGHATASAPAVVTRTANAIERGARKTGAAIERAATKTGQAIERGAIKTESAVRRGIQKTGQGIQRGGEKIEQKARAVSGSDK